jgi:hypothetical protein
MIATLNWVAHSYTMSLRYHSNNGQNLIVRDFQERIVESSRGRGGLEALEGAWKYYLGLTPVEQAAVRGYISDNGALDFINFLKRVREAVPAMGIADRVGIDMLRDEIEEHLSSLGPDNV